MTKDYANFNEVLHFEDIQPGKRYWLQAGGGRTATYKRAGWYYDPIKGKREIMLHFYDICGCPLEIMDYEVPGLVKRLRDEVYDDNDLYDD